MNITRFFAPTNREVMRQVRQALGPDALIISSRSLDGGVEVMATDASALDDEGRLRMPAASASATPAAPAIDGNGYPDRAASGSDRGGYSPDRGGYTQNQGSYTQDRGGNSQDRGAYAQGSGAYSRDAAPVRTAPVDEPVHAMPAVQAAPQAAPQAVPHVAAQAATINARMQSYMAVQDTAPVLENAVALVEDDTPQFDNDPNLESGQFNDALQALRGALETRIDGLMWSKGLRAEPVAAKLFRTLMEAGFSATLARAMVDRLPAGMGAAQALSWARNELIAHLPVMRHEDDLLAGGGVFALVGPTGVGKTTTLAKLAARCVAREGREQVAMLTTDNFRIGAHEQLQIYGRLLGVPTRSVRDASELRTTLAELGNRKIVLIDTTGISQRDRHVAEQAAMLCGAGRPVQRLVVLNAASQGDTLDEVAHAYRNGDSQDVRGCIITKVDEASRYAAALDTAIRHRLPIHYVSRGQRVPEHMEVPTSAELIDGAFACLKRHALYTPSEADLAALWSASREALGESADPLRRRQLLASAMMRPQGGAADGDGEIDAALAWMNTDPACVQARDAWRRYGSQAAVATQEFWQHPLDMARIEFPAACSRHMLAIHGKAPLRGDGLPKGALMATLLMSDRGAALAAPVQQLMLEHGMVSTCGPEGTRYANVGDAMAARAAWLADSVPQLPLVHVLEAGTAGLWQQLSDRGHAWLARCTGALRVVQDDTPTTLQAVGKTLGYVPVGQAGDMPGLSVMAGEKRVPLRLWAAGTEVALSARGNAGAAMRLVCAKLIDPSGNIVSQIHGLSNIGVGQADAAAVARWLVLHDQAKTAFRYMVHAWQPLAGTSAGDDAMARQALMAGQLGAACWQLAHASSGGVMRRLLQSLMGPDRKLPARLVPPALLRFFAMVEMAG